MTELTSLLTRYPPFPAVDDVAFSSLCYGASYVSGIRRSHPRLCHGEAGPDLSCQQRRQPSGLTPSTKQQIKHKTLELINSIRTTRWPTVCYNLPHTSHVHTFVILPAPSGKQGQKQKKSVETSN